MLSVPSMIIDRRRSNAWRVVAMHASRWLASCGGSVNYKEKKTHHVSETQTISDQTAEHGWITSKIDQSIDSTDGWFS